MTKMNPATQTTRLAILFADISVNNALYDTVGDDLTRLKVINCLELMSQEVARHHGTLVQTIVNEIFCSFATPEDAVLAACAMQNAVQHAQHGGEFPLHIRIGIHYGDVTLNGNEVSGESVNMAARVTALTRARQIMTTRAVADALPKKLLSKVRQIKRSKALGKQESLEVFLVTWEYEDTTLSRVGLPKFREPREARNELLLRYHEQMVMLNEQHKSVVLGRGDSCDLIIQSHHASRQHASIELHFNKFVLVDHSANGTYIRFSDKRMARLLHSEITLHSSGTISLGQPYSDNPGELIEFILQ